MSTRTHELHVLAAISHDARLSLRAKGFAALLAFRPTAAKTNMEALASSMRDGMETSRTAFRELKRYGYVEVDRPRDDKGRLGSPCYRLMLPVDRPGNQAEELPKQSRHGTAGSVYAIASGSRVKIGRSYDPTKRLSSLQSGSAERLCLLWTKEGGAALELFLHDRLADRRIHGEWFDLSGCNVSDLLNSLAAELGGAW